MRPSLSLTKTSLIRYNKTVRTFEYRLYPARQQAALLMACLKETRLLYNEMLERSKANYDAAGKFLFRYDLTAAFKGRGGEHVPASTVQTLADRLDKALRRFLRAKGDGRPCGFPRFKSANQWHSIQLRQHETDFSLADDGKRLKVPAKLGKSIKVKMHRPLVGIPKTAHLVLRADRHWYILIVCETPEREPAAGGQECEHPAIGLDVGLKVFLADSEGNTVANPRCYQKSLRALRRKQRTFSRRTKGSRRRRKAARNVAKTHLKVSRQRRDFLFKTAKPYAEGYARIAVEDLNVAGVVRNHSLARSISDASWNAFLDILTVKAASAGHEVIRVPAHFTSQACSQCGALVQKSLSVRTHLCPHCGYVADRDVNAARNILLRAGAPPSGANANVG